MNNYNLFRTGQKNSMQLKKLTVAVGLVGNNGYYWLITAVAVVWAHMSDRD